MLHAGPIERVSECVVGFLGAKVPEFVVSNAEKRFSCVFRVWDEESVIYEPEVIFFLMFGIPGAKQASFFMNGSVLYPFRMFSSIASSILKRE